MYFPSVGQVNMGQGMSKQVVRHGRKRASALCALASCAAAAWAGDIVEAEKLLASGADVNWADSIGETALFGAGTLAKQRGRAACART